MSDLTQLPNIGPVLAGKLTQAGITTFDQLEEIGSIGVIKQICETDLSACYNMLFAIEGAIRGVRWHAIPKGERLKLKHQLDRATSGSP